METKSINQSSLIKIPNRELPYIILTKNTIKEIHRAFKKKAVGG